MCDKIGLYVVAAAVAVPLYFIIRRRAEGGQFKKDNVRIDGKVVVITGANTGIGKETAIDLARRGGKIYIACRDKSRAEVAKCEIIAESGSKNVFVRALDLTSFESIRKFADEFQKEEQNLHILINNAGVMASEHQKTKDDLELQIGTNHFGHFLLTNLLLNTIKSSAPSRIINVSSHGHKFGVINREDLQLEKCYKKWTAYFQSKLANVLFSRELAKRLAGTGVTVNSLHPGAVKTELGRHLTVMQYFMYPFRIFMKTPVSGAQTTIRCAVDPELDGVTGKYFADCKIHEESKAAQDDDTAKWLWDVSEKVTHLKRD